MNILIAYDSYTGGTELVSGVIEEVLSKNNVEVVRKRANDVSEQDMKDSQLIILGSPSWDWKDETGKRLEGMPHHHMKALIDRFSSLDLTDKRFGVFGLGHSSYTYFTASVNHLEDFVKKIRGKLLVDSLRIDHFYGDYEKNTQTVQEWTTLLLNSIKQQNNG